MENLVNPVYNCLRLSTTLPKLLGPETPDPIQAEAENHPVLFSQAHVEGRKLPRERTAVPSVSQGHSRADQRVVTPAWPLLEVKEERRATEKSAIAVAEKHRRAPLRATHCSGLKPARIGKPDEVRRKLDSPGVVKTLKHLDDLLVKPKCRREGAHSMPIRVDIGSDIDKEISARAITRIDVHR